MPLGAVAVDAMAHRSVALVVLLAVSLASGCLAPGEPPAAMSGGAEPFVWERADFRGDVGFAWNLTVEWPNECQIRTSFRGGLATASGLLSYSHVRTQNGTVTTSATYGYAGVHVLEANPMGIANEVVFGALGVGWGAQGGANVSTNRSVEEYSIGIDVRANDPGEPQLSLRCTHGPPRFIWMVAEEYVPVTVHGGEGPGARSPLGGFGLLQDGISVNVDDAFRLEGDGGRVFVGFHHSVTDSLVPTVREFEMRVETPTETHVVSESGVGTRAHFAQAYDDAGSYVLTLNQARGGVEFFSGVLMELREAPLEP